MSKKNQDRDLELELDSPQSRRKMLKKLAYLAPIVSSLVLSQNAAAKPSCPGQCPAQCSPLCTPVCAPNK